MALARLIVPRRRLVRTALVLAVAGILLAGADALARQRRYGGRFPTPTEESFDGSFNFCRAAFRTGRFGRGGGWSVDYPEADVNFSIRLSELTRTRVSFDAERSPKHRIGQLHDEVLGRLLGVEAHPGAGQLREADGEVDVGVGIVDAPAAAAAEPPGAERGPAEIEAAVEALLGRGRKATAITALAGQRVGAGEQHAGDGEHQGGPDQPVPRDDQPREGHTATLRESGGPWAGGAGLPAGR